MKLKNPKYVHPLSAKGAAVAAALDTYLTANSAAEFIDFAALRAQWPALASQSDGQIADIAKRLGYEVVSDGARSGG